MKKTSFIFKLFT